MSLCLANIILLLRRRSQSTVQQKLRENETSGKEIQSKNIILYFFIFTYIILFLFLNSGTFKDQLGGTVDL